MYKLTLFFLLVSLTIFAQERDEKMDDLLQQKLESISENLTSDDNDFSAFEEQLLYYKQHPLNLNSATREQLQQLIILDEIQINNLLKHIELNGALLNVNELQSIDGFDNQTIFNLLPYITVSEKAIALDETVKNGKSTILMRYQRVLETQKGYAVPANGSSNYYLGSPDKFFTRYRFNFNNKIMAGITVEKDPGEQFFKGSQKQGFDFYSAHVFAQDLGKIKALAIGDYQLQFGQGLVAWSGLAFNKTGDAIAVKRSAFWIHPHTSVDENLFLRGVAATVQLKKMFVTGFVSRKRIDANIIDTLSNGDAASVSALQATGEHATSAELADKHSIQQTIAGGDVSFKLKHFDVGATAMYTNLSAELQRDVKLYNMYEFKGKQLLNTSIHYGALINNFNFFGETALSDNGGVAYVNGFLLALDKRLSLSVLNRNYQRNYQSLMGNAFSEGTSPANERGTFVGLQVKLSSAIAINSYMDIYSFPWLRYQITAPSNGYEYFTQLNYAPNKKFNVYGRFRIKQKYNDLNALHEINTPVPVKQNNYRIHFSYSVNGNVRISARVECLTWSQETLPPEKGFLMFQDLHYRFNKFPVELTIRYALFETDSYNSRIYSYESDMPFTYSIPSYFYKGSRVYLMLNYDLNKRCSLWFRYGQTFYDNQKVISAGSLNEINGNTKSDVKIEMRYTF